MDFIKDALAGAAASSSTSWKEGVDATPGHDLLKRGKKFWKYGEAVLLVKCVTHSCIYSVSGDTEMQLFMEKWRMFGEARMSLRLVAALQ